MIRRRLTLLALSVASVPVMFSACSKTDDASTKTTTALPGFALTNDPVKAAGAAGVRMLDAEGTKVHYHPHLDVNVNGKAVTVPANIGIAQRSISELHTHDTTGTIHIEADQAAQFTLKQLMTEWGVNFDINCIATYCSDNTNELRVYANGQLEPDPTKVVFKDGQEIYVWYGPRNVQPSVPSSFAPAPAPIGR